MRVVAVVVTEGEAACITNAQVVPLTNTVTIMSDIDVFDHHIAADFTLLRIPSRYHGCEPYVGGVSVF